MSAFTTSVTTLIATFSLMVLLALAGVVVTVVASNKDGTDILHRIAPIHN
jgi:hypothetical protein